MVRTKKKAKLAQVPKSSEQKAQEKAAKKVAKKKLVSTAEERHAKKMERRRLEKKAITAEMWAEPAPAHLVGKLDVPRLNSKYRTYYEIADNHEKKKKKLEYTVTNNPKPPPGFAFVPIGDPDVTNKCKELSREREAMIFVVSDHKEENSKISEHVYRTGYHFRESIVEEVRHIIGETVISAALVPAGFVEPIPDDQEEINKQADRALRDLFPRIPNTDRQMIIDHAFKKGAMFAGEPTVGLQATIPLSRRVQLATLAHIRHTHTRYDKLLKETTWMNARKVVEPVCLDVLLKWRGDEETGRDQMDEILREVVIITDSEADGDTSDEEDSSEDEGEVTSSTSGSSTGESVPVDRSRKQTTKQMASMDIDANDIARKGLQDLPRALPASNSQLNRRAQKGFHRYRNALADAIQRRDNRSAVNYQREHSPSDGAISQPGVSYRSERSRDFRSYEPMSTHGNCAQDSFPGYTNPQPDYSHLQPRATGPTLRADAVISSNSDRIPYSQPPLSLLNPMSNPPQAVRGTEHGLQDLLVPSIEPGAGAFSSARFVEHSSHSSARDDDFHSRMVAGHRRTPPRRQIIVIDDDSPQAKRQRLVGSHHHDQPTVSHSRPSYVPYERFESPFRGGSAVGATSQSHVRPPPNSQYNLPSERLGWSNPAERSLPVYDAPDSGTFSKHPRHLGISEVEYRTAPHPAGREIIAREYDANVIPREDVSHLDRLHDPHLTYSTRDREFDSYPSRQQTHDSSRYLSSNLQPSEEVMRSHPASSRPAAVDQNFVQSFSQSHLGGHARQRSDGVIVLSEGSRPLNTNYGRQPPRYGDRSYGEEQGRRPYQRPLKYGPEDGYHSNPEGRAQALQGQISQSASRPTYIVLD